MRLRAFCWLILLLLVLPAYADPILGSAGGFAVLGGSGAVTNTGPTTITGDLGVSPGSSITNTAGITINGVSYPGNTTVPNNPGAATAQTDATNAYNGLAAMAVTQNLTGDNLGGLTLTPGVYEFTSSAQLTGTLTLNAEGSDNALWVFLIGSTLTTASDSSVDVINPGSNPDDGIFWDVGTSATLGTTTAFEGNILAFGSGPTNSSITLDTGATIDCGSALAATSVTLDNNTISTGCNGGGTITGGVVTPYPATASTPEPGSIVLFASGLFALAGMGRRKLLQRL